MTWSASASRDVAEQFLEHRQHVLRDVFVHRAVHRPLELHDGLETQRPSRVGTQHQDLLAAENAVVAIKDGERLRIVTSTRPHLRGVTLSMSMDASLTGLATKTCEAQRSSSLRGETLFDLAPIQPVPEGPAVAAAIVSGADIQGALALVRAEGAPRKLSFLLEASFVTLVAIAAGTALGLIVSFNVITDAAQLPSWDNLQFVVPWATLAFIFFVVYVAALVTTWAPARRTGAVYPAEALRYQ